MRSEQMIGKPEHDHCKIIMKDFFINYDFSPDEWKQTYYFCFKHLEMQTKVAHRKL